MTNDNKVRDYNEEDKKTYTLLGSDLRKYQSNKPGTFGGYRRGNYMAD